MHSRLTRLRVLMRALIAVINVYSFNILLAELYNSFTTFRQPLCEAALPGIVETLVITCFIGFFNILATIFGVCFVLRNKIDLPQPRKNSKGSTKASSKASKTTSRSNSREPKQKQTANSSAYYNQLGEEDVNNSSPEMLRVHS